MQNINIQNNTGTVNVYGSPESDTEKKAHRELTIAAVDKYSSPLQVDLDMTPWGDNKYRISFHLKNLLIGQVMQHEHLTFSSKEKTEEMMDSIYDFLKEIKADSEKNYVHSAIIVPNIRKKMAEFKVKSELQDPDSLDLRVRCNNSEMYENFQGGRPSGLVFHPVESHFPDHGGILQDSSEIKKIASKENKAEANDYEDIISEIYQSINENFISNIKEFNSFIMQFVNDSGSVATYSKGTHHLPEISIDIEGTTKALEEMNENFDYDDIDLKKEFILILISSIIRELYKAIKESCNEEYDEDEADDFARYYIENNKVKEINHSKKPNAWVKIKKSKKNDWICIKKESSSRNELIGAGVSIKGDTAILYRGTNVDGLTDKDLRYGDFLSAVPNGTDSTGNSGADSYGKYVVKYEIPIKHINVSNGELQYKGPSLSLSDGNKYPESIYKAFNDSLGSNFRAKEIDEEDPAYVRGISGMALSGGKEEFDEIMRNF